MAYSRGQANAKGGGGLAETLQFHRIIDSQTERIGIRRCPRLTHAFGAVVEALEAAQTPKDAAGDHTSDAPDAEGRGLRLFNWRRRRQALSEEESDG